MSNVLLLKELRKLTKRNDKLSFIKKHENNEEFMYYLKVLLDSTIVMNVKMIPEDWYMNSVGYIGSSYQEFKVLVEYLEKNNRSSKTLEAIEKFLRGCNRKESSIYAGILTKNYKVGVTGASVNKAIGKPFVVDFKLEKAEPFKEELITFSGGYILGEEKYDGVRCAIFYDDGRVTALSYNNSPIHLPLIGKEIKRLAKKLGVKQIMFDGELLSDSARISTAGLVNRLIKKPECNDDNELYFKLFHFMTIDEFKSRDSKMSINDVALELEKWRENNFESSKIKFSVFYVLRSMEEVHKLFNQVRNGGGEGIMLKIPSATYEWKRSKTWIKMKSLYSTTLEVIDIYKAGDETKYKGLVGGIICTTKDGFEVSVGSGLSDDERMSFLSGTIIGKIVEVAFTDVNQDSNGNLFLDFPRFKGIRLDKTEPDTVEQMLAEVPKFKKLNEKVA